VTDTIENSLNYLTAGEGHKRLTLMVHPMVEAYLVRGWFKSIIKNWRKKYKADIHIESNSSMELLEYHIYNKLGEELIN
jgi:ribonuclease G